jgi:hypothetical protein
VESWKINTLKRLLQMRAAHAYKRPAVDAIAGAAPPSRRPAIA